MFEKDLKNVVLELTSCNNSFLLPLYFEAYERGSITKEEFGRILHGYMLCCYESKLITFEEKESYYDFIECNLLG